MFNTKNSYRSLNHERKITSRLTLLVLIIFFLLMWLGTGYKYKDYLLNKQLRQDTVELGLFGNSVSVSISKRLALLEGLAAFAESNPTKKLLDKEFETFAKGLYLSTEGIRNFAVAPGGMMQYVYPVQGNEKVYGHDLINDKRHNVRADVQRAINTKKVVISGPYELRQGGVGLVARKAVFVGNSFWGLATMVLDIAPIFQHVDLFAKLSEASLALRIGSGAVFYGKNKVFHSNPLIMKVYLTDDVYWELAGVPVDGWYSSIRKEFWFFQGISLVIFILLMLLIYVLITRQQLLKLKIHQRTEEIRGWSQVFKNTGWGVVVLQADKSTIERINPACARKHGYSVDELVGKTIATFFPSDFGPQLSVIMDKCHDLGNYTFEEEHIKKDGVGFPAYHDVTTIKDDEGKILYYIFNVEDITGRRKTEAELRKHKEHLEEIVNERTIALIDANKALIGSENRYRSLSDAAFEGIVLTENGKILEINNAITKMFGYELADIVNMEAIDLAALDAREDIKNKMVSGFDKSYETIGLKKDGTRLHVEVHARMFSYKGRDIRVASVRDLTESKRAEEALRESENKYQNLYDNAPDMFGSVDGKTATIVQCNLKLAEVLGYTKAEILGRPVFEFYTAESADYSKKKVFPEFIRTGIIIDEELQLQRKDGRVVDVSLNVTAFRDENNNIVHSNSVWRDITERKRAENALRESERMQGVLEMAGAVCHELNQPIMAIAGFSELILMKMSKEDPFFEKVSKIVAQSERLGEITLKLMNITKYSTKEYSEGQIIDIEKSSEGELEKN